LATADSILTIGSVFDKRRFILLVVASVASLTVLFTVQDAMRQRVNGGQVNWTRAIAINALDWVTLGLLLPFIVAAGRRIRLDGSGNRAARIAAWLSLAVVFCAVQATITGLVIRLTNPALFGIRMPPGVPLPSLGPFLLNWTMATSSLNLLLFGMTAGVFHAALYYQDLRLRQLYEIDLQGRLANAELSVLRTQLQPHFLFNALHTVSSLMVSDVPTAQRVVSALGDLLRASVDHTARQEVPLREELGFVERYVDIQRARFRQRLSVVMDVPNELAAALVPSLVLQPLVENAIRHGIEPAAEGGRITLRAIRRDGQLELTVENDWWPDETNATGSAPYRGGVGLANLESRLAQLYGSSHSFRAARNGDGRFTVTIVLPYHTVDDSRVATR
jgi:two-component system LytT family sensor kinase